MLQALRQTWAQNYKVVYEASDSTRYQGNDVISDGQDNVSALGRDCDS
jgi:hypothetical protein